jgi:transposase
MDTIGKIRRWHFRDGLSAREIAKKTSLSRNTVRKYLEGEAKEPVYPERQNSTNLDALAAQLTEKLDTDARLPRKQRRSVTKLFHELRQLGFTGSYGRVAAFVRRHRQARGTPNSAVFIPLQFAPGEAFQFDWSTEQVDIAGELVTLKVAHVRLCHSRLFFVKAYYRESMEMLFDAHTCAFAYFGGVPRRGIYDNMKTAVSVIEHGKQRQFNRRFLALASHYLFTPEACTPAAGWEKGQVENQVGNIREWLFVPRLKFATLADLNAWLLQQIQTLAQERSHPTLSDQTIADIAAQERAQLESLPLEFDGFHDKPARISPSSLFGYDRNQYSVPCAWVNQVVSLRIYADRINVIADGNVIAQHVRRFTREKVFYDPLHYLPALTKKPGALRNGAPFVNWELPTSIKQVQTHLMKQIGGDRQMVRVLQCLPERGIEAVAVACELALEAHAINADYIINNVHRLTDTPAPPPLAIADDLKLRDEPLANTARYNSLLRFTPMFLCLTATHALEVHYGT